MSNVNKKGVPIIYYIPKYYIFSLQSKLIIKKQYNYTVCLSPKRNRSTCDIYTRTKDCLVIKSWNAFRNTVEQLLVDIWKDLLITMCLTTALTTQQDQRNLQNVMKETLCIQCTAWEFPVGPSPQNDLKLRLVFPPELLCRLYAEYIIDMAIGIYNHAEKACWHAKTLIRD